DVDIGDPAASERNLATPGHAMRRSHHGVCIDDRRDVSHYSSGPAVVVFLADSLSQSARTLAESSFAAGLGFLRDLDLFNRQHSLPASADHSRLRLNARSDDGVEAEGLRGTGARLAR